MRKGMVKEMRIKVKRRGKKGKKKVWILNEKQLEGPIKINEKRI